MGITIIGIIIMGIIMATNIKVMDMIFTKEIVVAIYSMPMD